MASGWAGLGWAMGRSYSEVVGTTGQACRRAKAIDVDGRQSRKTADSPRPKVALPAVLTSNTFEVCSCGWCRSVCRAYGVVHGVDLGSQSMSLG